MLDDDDPARERIRINRNKISLMKARKKGGKRKGAEFAKRGNKRKKQRPFSSAMDIDDEASEDGGVKL